jgi:Zn-dependent protease with chaperone function
MSSLRMPSFAAERHRSTAKFGLGGALLIFFFTSFLFGCASNRKPVPVGQVPQQVSPTAEDEEYGQQVFRELSRRYPIDSSDARIDRVRAIVDRLTAAAKVDRTPWNVYVLVDPKFKNAGATRGNFIFIWTGLFDDIRNDHEFAAILGHELAHVLAGHTNPDPMEEVNAIIGGVAGNVAGQVVAQTGPYGAFANVASMAVKEVVNAVLVNPDQQRKELEADQIGIFLMADAGYDPRAALDFWERVKDRPGYSGAPIAVLSSHPSSKERLAKLKELEPQATDRFLGRRNPNASNPPSGPPSGSSSISSGSEWVWNGSSSQPPPSSAPARSPDSFALTPLNPPGASPPGQRQVWEITYRTTVYSGPDNRSLPVQRLMPGITVVVIEDTQLDAPRGRWLHITNPARGYIMSSDAKRVADNNP